MWTALFSSLALLPIPLVSVGTIQLHALWDQSSLVVLGRIEKVEKIRRELPEWATEGSRGPGKSPPETSIARLKIVRTFRGPEDVGSILIPIDRSFICDITTADPGETAIFFLEPCRVVAAEGTEFCAELDRVFGEHEFLKIGFWGRGRMKIHGEGDSKYIECESDVLFPENVLRATPFDDFCRILVTYRGLEKDRFFSASSSPGNPGELAWSLSVSNEGLARLLVNEPDRTVDEIRRRGREREYVLALDPDGLRDLRRSIESDRVWSLPSALGTMRPGPKQRGMSFVRKRTESGSTQAASEADVSIFAIDEGWMSETSRREATIRALRIWSNIRGLIQERGCADSRSDDQIWLAMAR